MRRLGRLSPGLSPWTASAPPVSIGSMLSTLEIHGVGPADPMNFEFGERLNVLTGDNGVGKSFVLDVVWWALTRSWAGLPAKPMQGPATITVRERLVGHQASGFDARYSYADQAWTLDRVHAAAPRGPVVYSSIDGFRVFDPHRNAWPDVFGGGPDSSKSFHAFRFGINEVWNGLEHDGKPVCNGLIRDWVSWMRNPIHPEPGEVVPFELLCKVLEILSDPDEPLVPGRAQPVFVDDTRDIPTLESPWGGEPIPVVLTSAGVRRIIMLAYLLTWVWYEHNRVAKLRQLAPAKQMYVILDELEMHLHPRWQRRIGPAILMIAKALDPEMQVQLFITTHSPLVLASLETHVEPRRDRLFNFDTHAQRIEIERLDWVKHGDATGWLSSPAFETSAYSVEAERAIRWAEDFMAGSLDKVPEAYRIRAVLEQHLAAVIASSDPFWVSWYSSRPARSAP